MKLLLIPLNKHPEKEMILSANIRPFLGKGRFASQHVSVYVNNIKLIEWIVPSKGIYKATIPSHSLEDKTIKISFKIPNAVSPLSLGYGEDDRLLGIAV